MTFARTWIKVPFMRFGRSITDKDGPAATASTRALASGLEQPACHGPLIFNETSTLENARGGSAPPSESRTALDPPRSQLPALASDRRTDAPAALSLMPSLSPLTPTARQSAFHHGRHCRGVRTHCWSKPCSSSVPGRPLDERIVCPQEHHRRLWVLARSPTIRPSRRGMHVHQ
jgi:hypothetical protein